MAHIPECYLVIFNVILPLSGLFSSCVCPVQDYCVLFITVVTFHFLKVYVNYRSKFMKHSDGGGVLIMCHQSKSSYKTALDFKGKDNISAFFSPSALISPSL